MKVNKTEYIKILASTLKGLPQQEKDEIIYDYEEHFRNGIERGKTEEEISISLGDPKTIARQYTALNSLKAVSDNTSTRNLLKAIFATSVLGFFNLIFVLAPFLTLAVVLLSFYLIGFAMILCGIVGVVMVPIAPFTNYIELGINSFSAICFSVAMAAFGILFFIFSCYINKLFFKLTVKYLKWNVQFINDRR